MLAPIDQVRLWRVLIQVRFGRDQTDQQPKVRYLALVSCHCPKGCCTCYDNLSLPKSPQPWKSLSLKSLWQRTPAQQHKTLSSTFCIPLILLSMFVYTVIFSVGWFTKRMGFQKGNCNSDVSKLWSYSSTWECFLYSCWMDMQSNLKSKVVVEKTSQHILLLFIV